MNPTEEFVSILTNLKPGDLGLLRIHAGRGLDETVDGFDLFTGLWWPIRAHNQRAPRRDVSWLVAKLYAFRPTPHSAGRTLASQLGSLRPAKGIDHGRRRKEYDNRFDSLLSLPLRKIEPALQWPLHLLASRNLSLDWAELTDDLSLWDRESKRLKWANEFLQSSEGGR
jgi:CRISPR type I-E-associated protein CasB/Cse2